MFLDSRREDKRFWTKWQQALPEFNLLFGLKIIGHGNPANNLE
jgi:hypothetical protein